MSKKGKVMVAVKTLFVNRTERRYRALWRILFQIGIMLFVVALPIAGLTEAATWLFKSGRIHCTPELFDKIMDMAIGVLLTVLVLLSISIAGRWLDHRKFRDFGTHLSLSWWKQYFSGIILASMLMALLFTVESIAGWVSIKDYFHASIITLPWWVAFTYPVIRALCVGVYEEALSRGYHITNLKEGLSGVWNLSERRALVLSVVLSSAFFGILHIRNPNAGIISTLSLAINGAFFATAYALTGQLALSMGLHTAWNLSQGWIFGFPVSGDPEIMTMIYIQQSGPAYVTGGDFGPEGGLLGLSTSIAGIIMLISFRSLVRVRKS